MSGSTKPISSGSREQVVVLDRGEPVDEAHRHPGGNGERGVAGPTSMPVPPTCVLSNSRVLIPTRAGWSFTVAVCPPRPDEAALS